MFDDDKLLRKQFSVQVSRENYRKLMDYRYKLIQDLRAKGVDRNVGFDDVITMLLIDNKNDEGEN